MDQDMFRMRKNKNQDVCSRFEEILRVETDPRPLMVHFLRAVESTDKLSNAFLASVVEVPGLLTQVRTLLERQGTSTASEHFSHEIPLARGREVADGPFPDGDGIWLRLEYVPCGSSRCKKEPDRHGPYWYQYRRVGSGWRSVYIGRLLPKGTLDALDEARSRLDVLSKKDSLSNDELLEIYRLIAALESIEAGESEKLQKRAVAILDCESIRRRDAARKRHEFLLNKTLAGTTLTQKEESELGTTAEALSWDH